MQQGRLQNFHVLRALDTGRLQDRKSRVAHGRCKCLFGEQSRVTTDSSQAAAARTMHRSRAVPIGVPASGCSMKPNFITLSPWLTNPRSDAAFKRPQAAR